MMKSFIVCKKCKAVYGCCSFYKEEIPENVHTCENCKACGTPKRAKEFEFGYCVNCLWDIIAYYNGG